MSNTTAKKSRKYTYTEHAWIGGKVNNAKQIAKKYKTLHDGSVNISNLRAKWTGKCYYCKCKLVWFDKGTLMKSCKSTIDHKIPFIKGGTNTIDNVVWCCRDCNRLKDTLSVEEFLEIRKWREKGHRRCHVCLEFKPLSKFHKSKRRWGGVTAKCKNCASDSGKK